MTKAHSNIYVTKCCSIYQSTYKDFNLMQLKLCYGGLSLSQRLLFGCPDNMILGKEMADRDSSRLNFEYLEGQMLWVPF